MMKTSLAGTAMMAVLAASPAHAATTMDDIRRSLAELRGTTPISATIEISGQRVTDKKKKYSHTATVTVEHEGAALRISFPQTELTRMMASDPDDENTVSNITARRVYELINTAALLSHDLQNATIERQTPTHLDGKPVTLVELKLTTRIDEDDKKYVKGAENHMKLWLDTEGVPVAAETRVSTKFRFLVLSGEFASHETYRFTRIGDRLVTLRHVDENRGAGLGREAKGTTITTLAVSK